MNQYDIDPEVERKSAGLGCLLLIVSGIAIVFVISLLLN